MGRTSSICAHRAALDVLVTAFASAIREDCPGASLEIAFIRYEDEDAHIWVTPPVRLSRAAREELANRVAQMSLDILVRDGLLILAGLEENGTSDRLDSPAEGTSAGARRGVRRHPSRRAPAVHPSARVHS